MTRRRHLGPLLLAALLAAPLPAAAQGTPGGAAGTGGPQGADRKPKPPRRRARRRDPAGDAQQQQAAPEPAGPRLEAAPVPNRDLEGPRAPGTGERARLSPSVIHRPLPNQNMAAEGAQNIQEERLFFPAPGARLNVPFSY